MLCTVYSEHMFNYKTFHIKIQIFTEWCKHLQVCIFLQHTCPIIISLCFGHSSSVFVLWESKLPKYARKIMFHFHSTGITDHTENMSQSHTIATSHNTNNTVSVTRREIWNIIHDFQRNFKHFTSAYGCHIHRLLLLYILYNYSAWTLISPSQHQIAAFIMS